MITADKIKLGKRIRELRVSLGLSQDELCDKLDGVESSYLSKIESGKYAISSLLLIKIINALEISPDEFFDYEHLQSEDNIDEFFFKKYKNFSLSQKRLLYRIATCLNEQE